MPKSRQRPIPMSIKIIALIGMLAAAVAGTYFYMSSKNAALRQELRGEILQKVPQRPDRPQRQVAAPGTVVVPAKVAPARPVVPRTGGTIRRVNRRNHYDVQAE